MSGKIQGFWDITPCPLVKRYWHFEGACCLCLQALYSTTAVHYRTTTILHNVSNYLPVEMI